MGFWSKEKEFAGLASLPLLEGNRVNVEGEEPYSIADSKARANILAKYKTNMEAYRMGYIVGFRKEYRQGFDPATLAGSGFLPEVAALKKLNEAAYLAWLSGVTSPPASSIISTATGPETPRTAARVHLQGTYNSSWSNTTDTLTNVDIDGNVGNWKMIDAKDENSGAGQVAIYFISLSGFPDAELYTNYTVGPPTNASTTQYESSSAPGDWYVYVTLEANVPDDVWNEEFVSLSPIITVKENNVMVENEREVINMMDDIGIDGRQMWDQLIVTCPESYEPPADNPNMDCPEDTKIPSTIDNAYILTGVAPDTDDSGVYAAIFQWFDTFTSTSGTFSLSMDKMYMNYDFDATKSSHSGVIGKKGTYTKILSSSIGTRDVGINSGEEMVLQWQNTSTTYQEIRVTNFNQEWAVIHDGDHWKFNSGLSWDGDTGEKNNKAQARLILTLDMYNNMDWEDWVPAHETGMCLVAFSIKTIKLKWWQTGIGKILIMVAVAWISMGTLTPTISAIIDAAIDMAIAYAIGLIAQTIAASLDSEILQAIVFFAAAVVMSMAGNADFSALTGFKGYLKMASSALDAYNQAENLQMAQHMIEDKEEMRELEDENDELQEKIKAMESVGGSLPFGTDDFDMNISSVKNGGILDPEAYYNQKYGGQIYDYDHLYDVDAAYTMRKNVKT